jgi:adenylylsulfate kinase-like enzyme
MDPPFIHGRLALADADELMRRFGDDAGFEAAARAERSRDLGNVARFCHWRQIERVIATLSSDDVRGTVH